MIEGRGFSSEDQEQGNNVIIINEKLADENDLKLGDTVSFVGYNGVEPLDEEIIHLNFEIIGLFRYADRQLPSWAPKIDRSTDEGNHAFIPDKVLQKYKNDRHLSNLLSYEQGRWNDPYPPYFMKVTTLFIT